MIESLQKDTCDIYRRKATVKDGAHSANDYDLFEENVPCLFLP